MPTALTRNRAKILARNAALIASGFIMYVRNVAPAVPTLSAVEAAKTGKPYVVGARDQPLVPAG